MGKEDERMSGKCDECMHRINDYCRAYKFPIQHLTVDKCKRRKEDEKRMSG